MRSWEDFVRHRLLLPELSRDREARIVRELADQLEDFYREAISRGLSETEADDHARRQVRDWSLLAEEILRVDQPNHRPRLDCWADRAEEFGRRKNRRWNMFSDLLQDGRHAFRLLARNPGFALVAILTLALGIGAATAIFSAVHAVLLRPLPYKDPERLALVALSWPSGRFWLSEKEVLTLRESSTLFEDFAALDESGAILLGEGGPEWLNVALISANTFPLLGVEPGLGRGFTPEEEKPDGPAVAILSHALWQRRFGGDPGIVGRVLDLDGDRPTRVVGVMPRGFRLILSVNTDFHQKADIWIPHQIDYRTADRGRNLIVLTRAKKGVAWSQAQQELERIAKESLPPDSETTYRAFPLHQDTVRAIEPALLILLAATCLVLLIVCANVASLLLARGGARRGELAVRTALGASRLRIIRQSLTESGVLAVIGGIAGIALAWCGVTWLSAFLPPSLPLLNTIRLSPTVLGISLAATLAAGLFFGVFPAYRASRVDLEALKEGNRGGGAGRMTRLLHKALVAGEIALSFMLLASGSLILLSFLNLQRIHLGYNPSNITTFTIVLPPSRYQNASQRTEFFRLLQQRILTLPHVESVGGNSILPFGQSLFETSFTFYGTDAANPKEIQLRSALTRPTLPGYFETLNTHVAAGRSFSYDDGVNSARVAIVDETLARSVWPGQNPLGKRIARGRNPDQPVYATVVGVVENLRITNLDGEPRYQVYVPYSQLNPTTMSFVVRTKPGAPPVLEQIRGELRAIDSNLPLFEAGRLDETVAAVIAPQRLTSLLMVLFAAIGMTLVLVGVFGVVSYTVAQRTREIGIRVALGAGPGEIYRWILGSGLRLAISGVALGLLGAVWLAKAIEGFLFGVSATHPATYALVPLSLLLAVAVASHLPARRAARADPVEALRRQ